MISVASQEEEPGSKSVFLCLFFLHIATCFLIIVTKTAVCLYSHSHLDVPSVIVSWGMSIQESPSQEIVTLIKQHFIF